jgi:hypothetical protein
VGWETRQRGGRYYYQCVRVGGKPRRLYWGAGLLGQIHERLDLQIRRARQAERDARRTFRQRLAEQDRVWAEVWAWARAVAAAELLSAGWYYHHGEWRVAMERPRSRQTNTEPVAEDANPLRAELAALAKKANAGDPAARAGLRRLLDEHPQVWRALGDLNRLSMAGWTERIAGGDVLGKESMTRFVDEWKRELAGPDPTPAERALADVAAVARLALAHAEFGAAGPNDAVPVAAFRARRLDSALYRLTATLRLLAQVRSARHGGGLTPASPPAAAGMPRPYAPPHERKVAV